MIPELGHFSLVMACVVSILMSMLPLIGSFKGLKRWMLFSKSSSHCNALLVLFAYICLTWSFIDNDFSVSYVANISHTHLPLIYKISGVWGGHEGSLLLWALILSLWTTAVSTFSRSLPEVMIARIISVMGMINVGFLLFILLTSSPFDRISPVPLEGRDLNPLLQDVGLTIHPPMLYLGYVGFSVPFAFAVSAMISGRFDSVWAKWSRPWTNVAWMFLTIGITLGSWWAYYELGWGGWWFWDPVENASFMPWLVGTALIHSLSATEKRGVFKAWSLLLSICTFALSLLGTFLVRSGILNSVHGFAMDPERGLFILIFLGLVIGGSFVLYAWRAPKIISCVKFGLLSKEMALLFNSIFLGILCFSVFIGTIYPLILDALDLGKISVGPPYFNRIFSIIGIPLGILIGLGSLLRWKKDQYTRIHKSIIGCVVASIVIGIISPMFMSFYSFGATLGITVGTMTILFNFKSLAERTQIGRRFRSLKRIPLSMYGMVTAHVGIGLFIIGVTMTHTYSIEKNIRIGPGEQHKIENYQFFFKEINQHVGPNYYAIRGTFDIKKNDQIIATLKPEKRMYLVQQSLMTEAAIDPGLTRDLYVALGNPLEKKNIWAVRIYYKPFIRLIWLGALIMAVGSCLAASDKRYRSH